MKKYWIWASVFIILLVIVNNFFFKRFDFTVDKRYTLTKSTQQLLHSIDQPLQLDVYLQGNFPAKYKNLQAEVITLIEEFQQENPNISYKLIDPVEDLPSTDTLQILMMKPSMINQVKDGQMSQILIVPYANATLKNGKHQIIPLLLENSGKSEDEMITFSIENLEYSFANALQKLQQTQRKTIGFVTHHRELKPDELYSFHNALMENYNILPFFPSDSTSKGFTLQDISQAKKFDALVIAKPRTPFSDLDKEVIDQYIMNGGKTIWMIDAVNAEMDTLYRSQKILAYPYELGITDLLFSYGVRINTTILKDAERNAQLNLIIGEVQGNSQYQTFNWPYFPLGIADENHPITKNVNPVKFEFPSQIDTLANGIKKTILYKTSSKTATLAVPNYIQLEELAFGLTDSLVNTYYTQSPKILAVLLEGKFQSAYTGRFEREEIPNFKAESKPTKMIVIADGDVAKNQFYKGQPMELGQDKMTKVIYGNKNFLKNAIDYLLDDAELIALRNRTIDMKLLNAQKIMNEKLYWQWFNTLLPLLIVWIFALLLFFWRRKWV